MYVECIKGFTQYGVKVAVIQGEIFKLVEGNNFVGVKGGSRNPGVERTFNEEELKMYFKLTLLRLAI